MCPLRIPASVEPVCFKITQATAKHVLRTVLLVQTKLPLAHRVQLRSLCKDPSAPAILHQPTKLW